MSAEWGSWWAWNSIPPTWPNKLSKEMLARKIVINRTHETTLRFLPPFIIERKHVDQVVEALDSILSSCKQTGDAKASPLRARSTRTGAAEMAIAGGSKKTASRSADRQTGGHSDGDQAYGR